MVGVVNEDKLSATQAKRNGGGGHQLIDMRPFSTTCDDAVRVRSDSGR
jgi:hypothetical protein